MTQPREPHDGLRSKFLRQFHAALVGRAVGIIEIDVGQLLRAAQRAAFDLFDLRQSFMSVSFPSAGVRKGGGRGAGSRAKSCSRWTGSSRCDQAIMSLRRRLSSSAAEPGSSIPSSVFAASSRRRSFVRRARQAAARGATDCRRTALRAPDPLRSGVPKDLRQARRHTSRTRRRAGGGGPQAPTRCKASTGWNSDVGDFRRWNEIDRCPAQIGGIGTLAAGGKTGCRQAVAAIALACRKDLEYGAHRQQSCVDPSRGKRAISLRSFLRLVKRNRIKLAKALHGSWRHCGQKRLFAHVGFSLKTSLTQSELSAV